MLSGAALFHVKHRMRKDSTGTGVARVDPDATGMPCNYGFIGFARGELRAGGLYRGVCRPVH